MSPKKKILVVDDDESFCSLLKEVFENRGFEVSVCFDPIGGCAAVASLRPDLVVADVEMPAGGGERLFRSMRKTAPETPLIVVSGAVKPDQVWERLEAVPNVRTALIQKPVRIPELLELAGRMLDLSA